MRPQKYTNKMKPTLLVTSRQVMFREMKDYLMIALGMILYGIGWTVFLLPNDITTGGVPGIHIEKYLYMTKY